MGSNEKIRFGARMSVRIRTDEEIPRTKNEDEDGGRMMAGIDD